MSNLRTRFAPSPTGYLHLGSARTALFNRAYAHRHGGTFVLRIEDTDRERSTRESEAALLRGLEWLGLRWDEGPHRQSASHQRHAEVVEELLTSDKAYRCVCTREALEARKLEGGRRVYDGRCREAAHGADCGPHTVRLRIDPDAHLGWNDLVFGPSGQSGAEIGDMIIRRSDGTPLYNLAVVVDDIDQRISHVIRGADHHSNTPLQIAIYRALDAHLPEFAHVPLIVNASGKKLSKRRDPVSIEHFQQEGYLHEALANWLVRLGWSHGDQEIFSLAEIETLFDLDSVGRSGARAEIDKLQWLNQHYLKQLPRDDLWNRVSPFLAPPPQPPVKRSDGLEALLDLLRERSKTLADMAQRARWQIDDDIEYDEKAAKQHLKPRAISVVEALLERMEGLPEWNEASLEEVFVAVAAENDDMKMGKLAQPIRVAITGGSVSPGIYETLSTLGRDKSLDRIRKALVYMRGRE